MHYPKKALIIASLVFASWSTVVMAETAADVSPTDLTQVIAARNDEDRARDGARHPQETLAFFQVEPGMTVVEVLPTGGWYTRILGPYLGATGALYGVNYVDEIWPLFGFMDEKSIESHIASTKKFIQDVEKYTDNGIQAEGFTFSTVPEKAYKTADRVLIIRAMHNLNRFEDKIGSRSQALSAVRVLIKDGGLVGVVQHRLPESADEAGADGSRGYLKQSTVIEIFEQAGFVLIETSEINANPNDQPGPEDIVWRLPPSLAGSKNDPERMSAMNAIGESDRMTLLFKKAP